MIFQGNALSVSMLEDGIAELCFDLQGESVNKFNKATVAELNQALIALAEVDCKGLLVTSGKPVFIVGADITEFVPLFDQVTAVKDHLFLNNDNNRRLESLPMPVVVAINGFALGGGLEICLACDARVMSSKAQVGLPEVGLGLIPGWGGTVRLARVAGAETAIDWITTGASKKADAALAAGVVDSVVEPEALRAEALALLGRFIRGELDYSAKRALKDAPLVLTAEQKQALFVEGKAVQGARAQAVHAPAALIAIEAIAAAADKGRDAAVAIEADAFMKVFATDSAKALVGNFLSEQLVTKKAKQWEKRADKKIAQAAVLGAGIMGGGIAYQSSLKGVPVKMKDIAQAGLDLGIKEATSLLSKRVGRGQMTQAQADAVLASIHPTLSYDDFGGVDVVVEAVVENPKVKHAVLAEVEKHVSDDAVLASNTSTISITYLAEALQRPQNFCGMHFFNPVHAMPLVEVIRGAKTSDVAVARTVAYANAMGKKAIVVNDCPGFLVNRVLFPYFAGFAGLIRDGADFQQIDRVMEAWGWPMGPAYLMDVIGIDTCVHAEDVLAEGFPTRMGKSFTFASDVMYKAGRLGQKNGKGFYDYVADERGRLKKTPSAEALELLRPHVAATRTFSDEEIIARCLVPMATELARCLEEGVVESAAEADMALIYGLGFPGFRGGIFRWVDSVGIQTFVAMAEPLAGLGELYQVTDGQREQLQTSGRYY